MSASVIAPDTWEDEWFGLLSDREALIWIGVFGRLRDDQGRFTENVVLARSRLFPYKDVPVKDLEEAFNRFVRDGRLHRYEVDGRAILQIVTWWDHQKPQWAAPSKLPSPEGWTDRIRHRENGKYIAVGWDSPGGFTCTSQVNGSGEAFGFAHEPEPEPIEQELEELSSDSAEPDSLDLIVPDDFEAFWTAYPRRENRAKARTAWSHLTREEKRLAAGIAEVLRDLTEKGIAEKRFIPMPTTFIHGKRWEDWREGVPAAYCPEGNGKATAARAEHDAFLRRFAAERGLDYEPEEP